MRELGLKSVIRKNYVITTDSNHNLSIAENRLNRDFTSVALGAKWVSDITYIKVGNSWNYLTTVLDLADRKIVSWTISKDMTTQNTVLKAYNQALKVREVTSKHIFHSDRSVQYASHEIQQLFSNTTNTPCQSMSKKEIAGIMPWLKAFLNN